MQRVTALLFLAVSAAFPQQTPAPAPPPDPPACLSAPVTKGTVTLSCSVIDAITAGADTNLLPGLFMLGVKATSSDPEVVALTIEVATVRSTDPNTTPSSASEKRAVSVARSKTGTFSYVFTLNPTFDDKGTALATLITGITIRELKEVSSQSF